MKRERNEIEREHSKVVKRAVGLPMRIHTEDLLKLGVHNTAEETADAQERAQLTRLTNTVACKRILEKLVYPPAGSSRVSTPIPRYIRDKFEVAPVP